MKLEGPTRPEKVYQLTVAVLTTRLRSSDWALYHRNPCRHGHHLRPFALMVSLGNVSDVTAAPAMFEPVDGMRYLFGGESYDADCLQRSRREAGGHSGHAWSAQSQVNHPPSGKQRYRNRHIVENAFGILGASDEMRCATANLQLTSYRVSSLILLLHFRIE